MYTFFIDEHGVVIIKIWHLLRNSGSEDLLLREEIFFGSFFPCNYMRKHVIMIKNSGYAPGRWVLFTRVGLRQ